MSDECTLTIKVVKAHEDKVNEAFGQEGAVYMLSGADDGLLDISYESVNHGGHDGLGTLANSSVGFVGQHGAGGDYPAQRFVSDPDCSDGYQWIMSDDGGGVLVVMEEDGRIRDRQDAEGFLNRWTHVEADMRAQAAAAPDALTREEKLQACLQTLIVAGRLVTQAWGHGDLAGAVRQLDGALTLAEDFMER